MDYDNDDVSRISLRGEEGPSGFSSPVYCRGCGEAFLVRAQEAGVRLRCDIGSLEQTNRDLKETLRREMKRNEEILAELGLERDAMLQILSGHSSAQFLS